MKPASTHNSPFPVILTIAGSDSGGGAGIQADLKTITALHGFGTSVITALTAQNGAEVRGIFEVDPEFITLQLQTVLQGFPVKAAKTGMLASAPIIESVTAQLEHTSFPLVVDPVCVSQSGHPLLREDATNTLIQRLLPRAALVTPNRPEAELLTRTPIHTLQHMEAAALRFFAMGAPAVLFKGGHFSLPQGDAPIIDYLALPNQGLQPLPHPYVETPNNHGTGCTLSAAIATFLGKGETLQDSIRNAQTYLTQALQTSFTPGIGAGPPNFLGGICQNS